MSRYLRTYSRVRAISNKSNESNEYERTRIKVRSFVANGYSLRIVSCSEDSFDSRPCSLIIYSNGLKFGRFVDVHPWSGGTEQSEVGEMNGLHEEKEKLSGEPEARYI